MQVARFSTPSGRGNKSDDDDDGMDAAQLAQLRNSLPELLRDSWVPPSEPRDKLDYSMLPHAIEAEPRAPAGAPLVHIVFSDHIVQTIKQLRFEREFFVWRKRFESPLTAAFKRLVDARNQEYTEKKRSWRREHRTLLKEVHHHKTALFRTVRERRAFKFAAPLQRRYVVGCWLLVVGCRGVAVVSLVQYAHWSAFFRPTEEPLENLLARQPINTPAEMLKLFGLSLSDLDVRQELPLTSSCF